MIAFLRLLAKLPVFTPRHRRRATSGNYYTLLLLSLFFYACSNTNQEQKFRIGFAQCTGTENWKRATREGMQLLDAGRERRVGALVTRLRKLADSERRALARGVEILERVTR